MAGSSGRFCDMGGGMFIFPISTGGMPLANPGGGMEKFGGGKFGDGIIGRCQCQILH